ncbi:hypothetical protein [Brachyspira sp.]|uniref:hypothetical protein n=1 Tax=Brachyspira sp. TaxID=1977261 RepID=UPI00261E99EA|nr:hypothetical protein [Brachyspira sp.]
MKKLIVFIVIFILSVSFILSLSILGNIPRKTILKYNFIEEKINEENDKIYEYSSHISTTDKIFRHSDLFYIFLNEKTLPNYIKEIIPSKKGNPKIKIISSEKLDTKKEYEAEYILSLKDEVYIISMMICYLSVLLTIIFYIKNIKKRIILLYLSFLLLIIINTLFYKVQLNYIEIFFIISFYVLMIVNDFNFSFFKIKIKHEKLLLIAASLFSAFTNIFIVNFNYPLVGEDISMILTRSYSLLTYAENNGIFNIEFASPLFGAGLISYPNPQYDQFSVFYFLRYLMPFWKAYLLCLFLFSIIGFISYYYFNKEILKLNFEISLMSAILFSFTGYYIQHIMIGHWAFLYHPLTALIVYISFSDRFNYFIRVLINALLFSIMIFGGSMQTIFFYTCFTLLGIAALLFKPNKKFIIQCTSIVFSFLLGIILSISKFIQSVYFGGLIDRGYEGLHSNNPNLILRNISSTLFYPLQVCLSFSKDTFNLIWEYDIGLPIMLIILLFFMIFYYILNSSKTEKKDFINKYKFNIIFMIIFIYLYCDIFFANGIIRSLFPKLRSVNIHLRIASTLIIPIIMIYSLIFNKFITNKKNIIILFVTIISVIFYYHRFINIQTLNERYIKTNIDFDNDVFKSIKNNHDKYKVSYINNKLEIANMIDFTNGSYELNTSKLPYESIYGYKLETFKPKEEGSPYKIVNGKYNFTDPRSLIFFNKDLPQFSGFDTNDTHKLNKFLSFKEVKWEVPKYFTISNYISVISHIIVIFILVLYFIIKIIKKNIKFNNKSLDNKISLNIINLLGDY